jgi:hypothetical protein
MAVNQVGDGGADGVQLPATKVGFYGATPAAQPVGGGGNVHTPAAGSVTGVFVNTTFDGSIGTQAYTIGDIVAALKTLGLLAS